MLTLLSCLNWDSENSVQARHDEGGWQIGGLCWHITNVQLLYHRNSFLFLFCGYVSDKTF